jgi:hypothetical protein
MTVWEQSADALIVSLSHNFWAEVKRIRNKKACKTTIFDGRTYETSISQYLANKYHSPYSSETFDRVELQGILLEYDSRVSDDELN